MREIFEQIYYYLLVWDKLVIPPVWLILEVLGVAAGIHALTHKRDPRAALGWTAICIGIPGVGALLYSLFGVNRILTRAQRWQDRGRWDFSKIAFSLTHNFDLEKHLNHYEQEAFFDLTLISERVTKLPLLKGNHVSPLFNGEEAYPAMLGAIEAAKKWIFLSTYIFETNTAGLKFIDALERAMHRGVELRVLVDGVGARYARPAIQKILSAKKIPYVLFLPLTFSPRSIHMNLRTHRKILVVDGECGFTGGMNLGDRHCVELPNNPRPTQDIHFKVVGPVVVQLRDAFLLDWHFAKQEFRDKAFDCSQEERGEGLCRGIVAGPNEDFEKLKWIVEGGINAAKRHLRIMTPYFIPDRAMITSIITAVMRGVEVEIILPEKNNIPYVKWASQSLLEELVSHGVKVYYQPAPFAHSKYLLVDDFYSLVGSANLDPRSLRLNFEFNLEVYDLTLNRQLTDHFENVKQKSKRLNQAWFQQQSFFAQLRDSFAKLFSPYL